MFHAGHGIPKVAEEVGLTERRPGGAVSSGVSNGAASGYTNDVRAHPGSVVSSGVPNGVTSAAATGHLH